MSKCPFHRDKPGNYGWCVAANKYVDWQTWREYCNSDKCDKCPNRNNK